MHYQSAMLVVEDIQKARKFYEEVLKAEVILDFGKNITFQGEFSLQERAYWQEEMGIKEFVSGKNNFELYFEEENFNQFLEHFKMFPSVKIAQNMIEQPWGQRAIRFYDLDGHLIEVGEAMKSVIQRFLSSGMPEEKVAEKTMHPLEFVKQCKIEMDK